LIRNNQNRRRRGGNSGPRPQQMGGGNNYGNRLDNRQRGNASQLLEKYRALARDAQQVGDRVTAEYYLQYADHYYRVLGDYRDKTPNDGRQRGRDFYEDDATGYAANGDDGEGGEEDDQDNDRNDMRTDERSDEPRGQWRDERPNNGSNNAANRSRDGQRESRGDSNRSDGNRADANRSDSGRPDSGRTDGRDRQGWNTNGRSRDDNRSERARDDNRNENRTEGRNERPRDDSRTEPRQERPREDNRGDRNDRRERRPEAPRPAPVEAASNDEGPIPGLPGPATLRVKRPDSDAPVARAERAPRPPRREAEVIVAQTPAPIEVTAETDVAAPRKRGRPRKVVDAGAIEG
jgi:hypothetical protein